jgi:tetratricopeptide (TPR) repeat protein
VHSAGALSDLEPVRPVAAGAEGRRAGAGTPPGAGGPPARRGSDPRSNRADSAGPCHGEDRRGEAVEALTLVYGDPRRALLLAEEVLSRPGLSPATVAVAERAAALSELELGRVGPAQRRLERAKAEALASGLRAETAELQLALVVALLQVDEPGTALSELESAAALADEPPEVAAILSQRALVLMRLGQYDQALSESGPALALCRATGQSDPLARLLSNRGVVHAYMGDFETAEAELSEALTILRRLGYELNAVQVVHNLGFVAARRGDVPTALRRYDEALAAYERLAIPAHTLSIDRCELLMSARLLPEARAAAEDAVAGLAEAALAADLAEGRLMLAEVALAGGDTVTARAEAEAAGATFDRQNRERWAALARFAAARARWAGGAPLEEVVTEAARLAERLESAGWPLQGLESRIAAGRAALSLGRAAEARSTLSGALAVRSAGTADERSRAWYAVALLRLAGDDRRGALRALKAGLDVAERHRASFGATELRVRAATGSAELAELGLRLALASGRPRSVLGWAERWRARSLWRPGIVPSRDPELARRLTDLRHTVASLENRRLSGEGAGDLEPRRRRLESEIRHHTLRRDSDEGESRRPAGVPELREELSGQVLVEFVEHQGSLYAVVLTRDSCRLRRLGAVSEVERQRAALHFAASRLATRRFRPATLEAAAATLVRAARRADSLLMAPLTREFDIADASAGEKAGIVLVPTGQLHAMPWAMLPRLARRPVSVAPSAALWLRHARKHAEEVEPAHPRGSPRHAGPAFTGSGRLSSPGAGRTVLVAGPGIASAPGEIAQIELFYDRPTVLAGGRATAEAVVQALGAAEVAHIAAHGRFRADNALFSALELADGPLTVYELEKIAHPPRLVVLSACDGGRAEVHPGDELMGATAAMLSIGTRAIIASVAPVPDAGAPPLMASFHSHLHRAGCSPASALARSQSDSYVHEIDPGDLAEGSTSGLRALAGSVFVCFGAG